MSPCSQQLDTKPATIVKDEKSDVLATTDYGGAITVRQGPRYAAVYHLRSLPHNRRLRVRVFAPEDEFPVLSSEVR